MLVMQGWERAINNLSVRRPGPTISTHRMKEEKRKTIGDKRAASSKANKKALALLLKPASPTIPNMGSPRSFHRATA